jgi:hypothetical protein
MQQQKIEFRKEREFTAILGDSIKFLKQNFKPLFSAIILVIGPFILLTGLLHSYMQTLIMANSYSGMGGFGMFNQTYFMTLGIVYLLTLINSVLMNSVVYNYMCLYNEKPAGEKITVSEVASRVWSNLGRMMGSMLALIGVLLVIVGLLALIGIGFATMGVFGGILLALAIIFGALIYGPILVYAISGSFFVVVRDGLFIFTGFVKVRRYLSGNFWWTWLIIVVATLALWILQVVFTLPASIMTVTEMFTRLGDLKNGGTMGGGNTSVLLIVFYTIGIFLTTCSSSILHLVCGFNFLSQEEKHEGKGLMSRMEEIK